MAKMILIEALSQLHQGLIVRLKLEDGASGYTSNASDISGNGYNFTLRGDSNWVGTPPPGYSACLATNNAEVDRVSFPDFGTSDFSISAWVKLIRSTSNGPTFQKATDIDSPTNTGFSLWNTAGTWTAYYQSLNHTNSSNISTSTWTHATWTVTRSGNTIVTSYYENGIYSNQASSPLLSSVSISSSDRMYLGYGRKTSFITAQTYLSDVRMWSRALAPNEIEYLYQYSTR